MRYILIVVVITLFLASCSKNQLTNEQRDQAYRQYIADNKLESIKSINTFRYDGWQSLTQNFLILSTSIKRKYLIELTGICRDITFAQSLYINQIDANNLSARFDSFSTSSNRMERCVIKTIYPLTPEQAKFIVSIGMPKANKENS